MTTKRKTTKYDENKRIDLIEDVITYNAIGCEEGDPSGKLNSVYKTRKIEAQSKDNAQTVRIDEGKPVNKKTIAVPVCLPDSTYENLIKNKKDLVDELRNERGYKRVFPEDNLPNSDIYEASDADLEFIDKLNTKLHQSYHLSSEDFAKIIEIWETEVGQNVLAERKRTGVYPSVESNRLTADKCKEILRDRERKEMALFVKNPSFDVIVEDIHKYWDDKRKYTNHPFLRRFWKNYLRPDEKPQRKAFFEPRVEAKMKTRGSDTERLSDIAIRDKVGLE